MVQQNFTQMRNLYPKGQRSSSQRSAKRVLAVIQRHSPGTAILPVQGGIKPQVTLVLFISVSMKIKEPLERLVNHMCCIRPIYSFILHSVIVCVTTRWHQSNTFKSCRQ